jgi:hypothetical protein
MDPDEAADLVNSFIDVGDGDGTLVTFTRIVDTTTYPPTRISATCAASVRDYRPREITGGLQLGDTNIKIEGGALAEFLQQFGTPPTNGDYASYAGFYRKVEASAPIIIGDKVVLVDVLVRG